MNDSDSDGRCGRCGEPVSGDETVCSTCGALLAAYRTPEQTPPAPLELPSDSTISPATSATGLAMQDVEPPAVLVEETSERYPAPDEPAALSMAPAQEFDEAIVDRADNPAPPNTTTPSGSRSADVLRRSETLPEPALRPVAARTVSVRTIQPPRPRKPGYVQKGTVEPVVLTGASLLALAICLVVLASLFSLRAVAIAGFILGTIGIVAIVIALLVALIRRERDLG